jgi:hypothetical protein
MAYASGGGAAAAHAALVQAVKASGVLVRLEPDEFLRILLKNRGALVVTSAGGWWNRGYHYLTGYKGLAFYTRSTAELSLPGDVELIAAKQIWMPS